MSGCLACLKDIQYPGVGPMNIHSSSRCISGLQYKRPAKTHPRRIKSSLEPGNQPLASVSPTIDPIHWFDIIVAYSRATRKN